MGYQRDERQFQRGDDFGARGSRNEFGRNYDRSAWRDERGRDFEDRLRGFFERAADEVRSWFGDEDAERRRRFGEREDHGRDREERGDRDFRPGHRGNERWRERERGAEANDADFGGYGYGNWGNPSGRQPEWSRDERFGDPHYRTWRDRQLAAFDSDYDDYRRENQSRFDSDFGGWRRQRDVQRGHIANIQEHAEVESSDGQHVGTVDKVRSERIILTKSDPEAGGQHHWIPTSWVANVEHNKVRLTRTHEDAQKHWHEAKEEDGSGPHILGRSFAGTY